MGFLRKATFLASGGTSGLVIKANSKKERIANATEQQNRLIALENSAVRTVGAGTSTAKDLAMQELREAQALKAAVRMEYKSAGMVRSVQMMKYELPMADRAVNQAKIKLRTAKAEAKIVAVPTAQSEELAAIRARINASLQQPPS